MRKVLVDVDCRRLVNGAERPAIIHWEDGRTFKIDKVLHISFPGDGDFEGIRYTILIGSAEKYLYRDGNIWYVVPS